MGRQCQPSHAPASLRTRLFARATRASSSFLLATYSSSASGSFPLRPFLVSLSLAFTRYLRQQIGPRSWALWDPRPRLSVVLRFSSLQKWPNFSGFTAARCPHFGLLHNNRSAGTTMVSKPLKIQPAQGFCFTPAHIMSKNVEEDRTINARKSAGHVDKMSTRADFDINVLPEAAL